MTSKPAVQKNSVWKPIGSGAIKVLKMILSVFSFIFTASEKSVSNESPEESNAQGYRSFGFHSKSMRDEYD